MRYFAMSVAGGDAAAPFAIRSVARRA